MKICVSGKFTDERKAIISPLDNGFLYGDAFYDTMRTYNGKVLELEKHLKRIEKSAQVIGIKMPWRAGKIAAWIKKLVSLNRLKSARVRVTVSRGINGFDFLSSKKPTLVITGEKLIIDEKIYEKGVTAFTKNIERPMPQIKMVGLTVMIETYRSILPQHGYEAILIDDHNFVREGASTNLFVVKNNVLYTAKNKILPGLTRASVIDLAKKNRMKLVEKDFKKAVLYRADEIFLTNRPREIIPVVAVDKKKIGTGAVGPTTKKIMRLYKDYVETYLGQKKK